MKDYINRILHFIKEHMTYHVNFIDDFLDIKWEKVSNIHLKFWTTIIAYLVIFILSISTVILNLVLLFQGFLTQNPIIYLLFFITLVCAFYFAYKFITYTPTIVKNALQYIKKLKNV
ncbi:TPA: hypothetical protein ACGUDZ_000971 [Streptococcus agalactiae]